MENNKNIKAAELRRAYQKEWRAKNKDRVREYNRRFWEKQAEKQSEIAAERQTDTSEK